MSFLDTQKFSAESIEHFANIFNHVNAGLWEYNTINKKSIWSAGFYNMLGYKPGEIECSYQNFFENLLYFKDKKNFLRSTDQAVKDLIAPAHIRLLTKQKGYQWFESSAQKHDTGNGPVIYGMLININSYKIAQLKAQQNDFLSDETGRIAKIGGWEINVADKSLLLSKEIYAIYELQADVKLSVEEAVSFFEPPYRAVLNKAIENAINYCHPYDIDLQLRTAKNNVVWVRSKGIPVVDDLGNCITIRGVFQDIDTLKKRGLTLQTSFNQLDDQNKRLQNFAYIVSHNLRSHTGNLKFMVNLHQETTLKDDRDEIFAHIKTISDSLTTTISHLDEIVKIQTETGKERKLLSFEQTYNNVIAGLRADIVSTNADINTSFDNCPQISYVPAYLESIMHNLLTNALKYRHPDRRPVVYCKSFKDGDGIYLTVEDNGLGVDLKRYGEDIFGLYKTFHLNKEAKGIGLFITRNQVEALGGSIRVESTVNTGTKFTVQLV